MAGECLRRILLPDDELFDAIFETTDRGTTAFDGLREMLGRDGCTQFAIPAGFWGRFDDNSEVLWREKKWVARFLGEVRGSQTFETTQIASPLAVHGATNRPSPAWRGALDELTRLPASDWRSPTLVADDSVLERYPSPVDGEVAIVGAAAGIVTRSLVALKSVDRHRHYNRDVNPWLYNASGDPEIRGNQCAERKYPMCLPMPPELVCTCPGTDVDALRCPCFKDREKEREFGRRVGEEPRAHSSLWLARLNTLRKKGFWRAGPDGNRYGYFVPPENWDPASVSRTDWRAAKIFQRSSKDTAKGPKSGPIDAWNQVWWWDVEESSWDVQDADPRKRGTYETIGVDGRWLKSRA